MRVDNMSDESSEISYGSHPVKKLAERGAPIPPLNCISSRLSGMKITDYC